MPALKQFSARQAARLKTRLIAYRALASRSGAPLPLLQLVQEIADSEAAQPWLRSVEEDGDDPHWQEDELPVRTERADKGFPMTSNVLQKWFSGELVTRGRGAARIRVRHFATPSPANLMAIYAFLREKKFITDPELTEDPWPYAVLATAFRDYIAPGQATIGAGGAPVLSGEFFSAAAAGRDVIVRRISITERGLGAAVAVEERIMVFARTALSGSSSTTVIDLHRPRAVSVMQGWGISSGPHLSLFTNAHANPQPIWHEYKALKTDAEPGGATTLEFAVLTMRPGESAILETHGATNDASAFIEQALASLKADGTRVRGPNIKLLRPAHIPDTDAEIYALLARCFSFSPPYRFDWQRFALLTSLVQNINACNPESGGTILHLAARTLNRPAVKALIKRKDLDPLLLDHNGYYPSQHALETDSRSPIGHLLLKKEITAAQTQRLDYRGEIARLTIGSKNASTTF